MKTAMKLAFARIELMKDINPDSIHWEMFKNDYLEKEKEQIIDAFWNGDNSDCTSEQNAKEFAEQYYNQTYKNENSKL